MSGGICQRLIDISEKDLFFLKQEAKMMNLKLKPFLAVIIAEKAKEFASKSHFGSTATAENLIKQIESN